MIVLADFGNTRIKWALHTRAGLGDMNYVGDSPGDRLLAFTRALSKLHGVERIVVANVLGETPEHEFQRLCHERALPTPEFARTQAQGKGLRIAYADPSRLGVDRYLAMLGARRRTDGPFIVADCGTALTLDAVDARGRHLGGLILPGRTRMHQALVHDVPVLQGLDEAPVTLFGRDTAAGLHSGIELGLARALDGLCADMATAMQAEPVRFLTGGDAERLAGQLKGQYDRVPSLILEGLALAADSSL